MKFTKTFLKIFLPFCLIILGVSLYVDRLQTGVMLSTIITQEEKPLLLKEYLVFNYLSPAIADVEYLSREPILISYLTNSKSKKEIYLHYKYFMFSKRNYDQLRVLDTKGQELIRVNYREDKVEIVPDDKLQNKSDRPYFFETKNLDQHKLYISPLDLNIESGKVELPFRPMIRIAKPLFNSDGVNRTGILIINIQINNLLQKLSSVENDSNSESMMLDTNGYWMLAPKRFRTFGFMFEDGKNDTLQKLDPEAWNKISEEKIKHVQTDKGLYVFRKIHFDTFLKNFILPSNVKLRYPNANNWILISFLPKKQLLKRFTDNRQPLLIFTIGALGLLCVATLIITKAHLQREKTNEEISLMNKRLLADESLLQEKAQKLTEVNKELEQFIYISSHDLMEPLKKLYSFSEILEQELGESISQKARGYLNKVKSNAQWVCSLITDLRTLTKLGAEGEKKELCILYNLVSDILAEYHEDIENLAVTISLKPLPTIYCYPELLRLLFYNLIENALKYGARENLHINIFAENVDHQWIFSVLNTGQTIAVQDREKIFLPFIRLHSRGVSGTGMGLAICRKIVYKHQGRMWIDQNYAMGTAIKFTLGETTK